MTTPSTSLAVIVERVINGKHTAEDVEVLRQMLSMSNSSEEPNRGQKTLQVGKYNINISEALGQIYVGDRLELSDANIRAIAQAIREQLGTKLEAAIPPILSIDDLVQQARSRLYNIERQRHGTMLLWRVSEPQ